MHKSSVCLLHTKIHSRQRS